MKYLRGIIQSSESGVMFIMVLMLVAAVALLVLPMMLVSTTGLRGTNRSEQRFTDRYASDAGIEHALWNIKYGGAFLDGVPYTKTVNDLPTEITIRSGDPDPPTDVPMLKLVGGPAMSSDKIVGPTNRVDPCLGASCLENEFLYTMVFQNHGSEAFHMPYENTDAAEICNLLSQRHFRDIYLQVAALDAKLIQINRELKKMLASACQFAAGVPETQ